MLTAAFLLLTVTLVLGQDVASTTHPHHHNASSIPKETHSFYYGRKTHQLALKTHTNCYLMNLDHREQTLIRSMSGLHQLEGQLLSYLDKTDKHSPVDTSTLDSHLTGFCRDRQKNALTTVVVN